jgi:aminoglycoside phosphotransferase (APT) family kinase protein
MTADQAIDHAALTAWWRQELPQSPSPLAITLIAGGHSNLTYRVDDAAGHRYALRRPPLGEHPRGAHDVAREHRIQAALAPTAVPVPPVIALCRDTAVIGAPFYLMRWVDGVVVDSIEQVERHLPGADTRQRVALDAIDALARLHRVDIDAVGLGDLGPRVDHLPRLLARMHGVWQRTRTRELPLIDELHTRLVARCPAQRYTGLVHSDYRLGNLIVKPSSGALAAILDWELCALGDVLVDVAALLANWDLPDDPWPDVWMQRAPTRAGGFPSRQELLARYSAKTGFELDALDYYRAFCYWRIAIIAEGMLRRYQHGAMSAHTTDLARLERRVRERAELADRFLSRADGTAS